VTASHWGDIVGQADSIAQPGFVVGDLHDDE
jgi:hypothetical protein